MGNETKIKGNDTPQIYESIIKILAEVGVIEKDNKNQGQNFMYRSIDQMYQELHRLLGKYSVFTLPRVISKTVTERQTKTGTILYHVSLEVNYRIFAADGSFIETTLIGEAMDSGDKAVNKAMSIAHKYLFIQLFAIPTEEEKDPDAISHPGVLPSPKELNGDLRPPKELEKPEITNKLKGTTPETEISQTVTEQKEIVTQQPETRDWPRWYSEKIKELKIKIGESDYATCLKKTKINQEIKNGRVIIVGLTKEKAEILIKMMESLLPIEEEFNGERMEVNNELE